MKVVFIIPVQFLRYDCIWRYRWREATAQNNLGQLPVMVTGQTYFSSVTCPFWPVKILKVEFHTTSHKWFLHGIKGPTVSLLFQLQIFWMVGFVMLLQDLIVTSQFYDVNIWTSPSLFFFSLAPKPNPWIPSFKRSSQHILKHSFHWCEKFLIIQTSMELHGSKTGKKKMHWVLLNKRGWILSYA